MTTVQIIDDVAIEITMMSFARGVEEDEAASAETGRVVRRLTDEHIVTLSGRRPDRPVVTVVERATGDDAKQLAAGAALLALVNEVFRTHPVSTS